MRRVHRLLIVAGLIGVGATARAMEDNLALVLREPDFPSADSAAPSDDQLATLLPQARLATAAELPALQRKG